MPHTSIEDQLNSILKHINRRGEKAMHVEIRTNLVYVFTGPCTYITYASLLNRDYYELVKDCLN